MGLAEPYKTESQHGRFWVQLIHVQKPGQGVVRYDFQTVWQPGTGDIQVAARMAFVWTGSTQCCGFPEVKIHVLGNSKFMRSRLQISFHTLLFHELLPETVTLSHCYLKFGESLSISIPLTFCMPENPEKQKACPSSSAEAKPPWHMASVVAESPTGWTQWQTDLVALK